ncbi:MAG: hypothetical protein WCN87_03385 [Chlamydiota bacterium]
MEQSHTTTEDLDAWLKGLKEEYSHLDEEKTGKPSHRLIAATHDLFGDDLEREFITDYLAKASMAIPLKDQSLVLLNGGDLIAPEKNGSSAFPYQLLPQYFEKTRAGVYLRFQGRGIVINPGHHFLEHFHDVGLFIDAIDYVIVTSDAAEDEEEVKAIYDLNLKCNRQKESVHVISYYLHQNSYRKLMGQLKPQFKQEKGTVVPLSLFIDSQDLESIELFDNASLYYGQLNGSTDDAYAIRLDLKMRDSLFSIGYLTNPLSLHDTRRLLGHCDALVQSFKQLQAQELYAQIATFDSSSLQNDIRPFAWVLCDLPSQSGDKRLEWTKSIKKSLGSLQAHPLPGDIGLFLDLEKMRVKCSLSGNFAPLNEIRVIRSKEPFGRLSYLSSDCYL